MHMTRLPVLVPTNQRGVLFDQLPIDGRRSRVVDQDVIILSSMCAKREMPASSPGRHSQKWTRFLATPKIAPSTIDPS